MVGAAGRADVQRAIGQERKSSVAIDERRGEAVDLEVERLQERRVRLLQLMGVVRVLGVGGRRRLDVDLHVFAQGAGVGVGLGAAQGLAVVGLGGRVDLRVLLAVAAVGEASLAELTLEGLLTCKTHSAKRESREFSIYFKRCITSNPTGIRMGTY